MVQLTAMACLAFFVTYGEPKAAMNKKLSYS